MASKEFEEFIKNFRSASWPAMTPAIIQNMEAVISEGAFTVYANGVNGTSDVDRLIFFVELYMDFYEKDNTGDKLATSTLADFNIILTKYKLPGTHTNEVNEIYAELNQLHANKDLWYDHGTTRSYTHMVVKIPAPLPIPAAPTGIADQINALQLQVQQQQQQINQQKAQQLTKIQAAQLAIQQRNLQRLENDLARLMTQFATNQTLTAAQATQLANDAIQIKNLQDEIDKLRIQLATGGGGGGSVPAPAPPVVAIPMPAPNYAKLEKAGIHSTKLREFCAAMTVLLREGRKVDAFTKPWDSFVGAVATIFHHESHVDKQTIVRLNPQLASDLEHTDYNQLLTALTTPHVSASGVVIALGRWGSTDRPNLFDAGKEADFVKTHLGPILGLFAHIEQHTGGTAEMRDITELNDFFANKGRSSLIKAVGFGHGDPMVHAKALEYTWTDMLADAPLIKFNPAKAFWQDICMTNNGGLAPPILEATDFGNGMRVSDSCVVALALGIVKGFASPGSTLKTFGYPVRRYDADYGILLMKALYMFSSDEDAKNKSGAVLFRKEYLTAAATMVQSGFPIEKLAAMIASSNSQWSDIFVRAVILSCFLRAVSYYKELADPSKNYYLELAVSDSAFTDNIDERVPMITGLNLPNSGDWGITDGDNIVDSNTFKSAVSRIATITRKYVGIKKFNNDDCRVEFIKFYIVPSGNTQETITLTAIDVITPFASIDSKTPVAKNESVVQVAKKEVVVPKPAVAQPVAPKPVTTSPEKREVRMKISNKVIRNPSERDEIKTHWTQLAETATTTPNQGDVPNLLNSMITYLYANAATLKDMDIRFNQSINATRARFSESKPMPAQLAQSLKSYKMAWEEFTAASSDTGSE